MKINYDRILFVLLLGLTIIMRNRLCAVLMKEQDHNDVLLDNYAKDGELLKNTPNKVMLITIPKSGTHLLEKCLYIIDSEHLNYDYNEKFNFEARWKKNKGKDHVPPNHWKGPFHPSVVHLRFLSIQKNYSDSKIAYKNHLYFHGDYNDFLDSKNFKKILLLRDPRAILVSFANMVKEGFEPDHKIDFEDLLLDLIDGRQKNYIPWASSRHPAYPLIWEVGICNFYRLYLPFMGTKNCLTVRFENLIGVKGNGTNELQLNEIKQIAQHVGVALSDTKVAEIMHSLFGESATFNQGTIDGWKKYFTPVVKEAFKTFSGANELLITLGYEKDANW